MENVKQMQNKDSEGNTIEKLIRKILNSFGYRVVFQKLDTAKYGLRHSRDRWYLLYACQYIPAFIIFLPRTMSRTSMFRRIRMSNLCSYGI